jgi:DegV family protein with EDD domain
MFRIVTDGAADMPAGWEKEYDIQVIPINIQFGEKSYLQGVELSNEDFYRLVDESGNIPKTSQPSPFQFKKFYESVAKAGDTILSMHVIWRRPKPCWNGPGILSTSRNLLLLNYLSQ